MGASSEIWNLKSASQNLTCSKCSEIWNLKSAQGWRPRNRILKSEIWNMLRFSKMPARCSPIPFEWKRFYAIIWLWISNKRFGSIRFHSPALLCQSEIWNLKSEIWLKYNPTPLSPSEIWNLKSEIWNLKPETWNLKSEIWNPTSKIWNLKSEIWNLKSEI